MKREIKNIKMVYFKNVYFNYSNVDTNVVAKLRYYIKWVTKILRNY